MSVYARFEGEEAREVSNFRRADLVGLFTEGETFGWKIAGRGAFVATYKRPGSGRKDFVASLKKSGSERRYYVCRWRELWAASSSRFVGCVAVKKGAVSSIDRENDGKEEAW